jgi:hypothetical protein
VFAVEVDPLSAEYVSPDDLTKANSKELGSEVDPVAANVLKFSVKLTPDSWAQSWAAQWLAKLIADKSRMAKSHRLDIRRTAEFHNKQFRHLIFRPPRKRTVRGHNVIDVSMAERILNRKYFAAAFASVRTSWRRRQTVKPF